MLSPEREALRTVDSEPVDLSVYRLSYNGTQENSESSQASSLFIQLTETAHNGRQLITADCLTAGPRGHLRPHNFYGTERGNYTRNISTESILSTDPGGGFDFLLVCLQARHVLCSGPVLPEGEGMSPLNPRPVQCMGALS
jgi:hypothetical protein